MSEQTQAPKRFETLGNVFRGMTTVAAWIIVALLAIVGRMVWDDRSRIIDTQNRIIELIHNHDIRISVLENQRQNDQRNGRQY